MKLIIGEKELVIMSPKGRNKRKKIPVYIYQAVFREFSELYSLTTICNL